MIKFYLAIVSTMISLIAIVLLFYNQKKHIISNKLNIATILVLIIDAIICAYLSVYFYNK